MQKIKVKQLNLNKKSKLDINPSNKKSKKKK